MWQWIRHGAELDDGRTITPELVRELATSELEKIREEIGDDEWFENEGRPELSREIFEEVALSGTRSSSSSSRCPPTSGSSATDLPRQT